MYPSKSYKHTCLYCGSEFLGRRHGKYCNSTCQALARKKTESDYNSLALERDLVWLGPFPDKAHADTLWQCKNNHTWAAPYTRIKSGHGCPKCAFENKTGGKAGGTTGRLYYTAEDYTATANALNLKWLGREVVKAHTKTTWQCITCGHTWEQAFAQIKHRQTGCPACARKKRAEQQRKKPEDYHELALSNNITWLGPYPLRANDKTTWQCEHGHIFETSYVSIKSGHVCRECSYAAHATKWRKNAGDYHEIARQNELVWIGKEIPDRASAKTLWGCKNGHSWETTYSSIQQGRGCPTCAGLANGVFVSRQQRSIAEYFGGELNVYVMGFCVDVYCRVGDTEICIEYDGWHWHQDTLKEDTMRYRQLANNGYKVLQIQSDELIPSDNQLQEALDRLMSGEQWVTITMSDWAQE